MGKLYDATKDNIKTPQATDPTRRMRKQTHLPWASANAAEHFMLTRGGATVIKMVRQNRGAAGAEARAEGTRMEAP